MAVKLRLRRVGAHKNPIWRVVVADSRFPRDGRVIETIGHYNPQTTPSQVQIDVERAQLWLARGAQPSEAVRKLLRICEGKVQPPAADVTPAPSEPAEAAPAEQEGQPEGEAQAAQPTLEASEQAPEAAEGEEPAQEAGAEEG